MFEGWEGGVVVAVVVGGKDGIVILVVLVLVYFLWNLGGIGRLEVAAIGCLLS